jgi:fucose permease
VSAGLIRVGVPPVAQFVAVTAMLAALVPAFLVPLPESRARAGGASSRRRFALPGRGTLLIGGFALAGVVLEGTTRSWSVIYVRDLFGAAEWIAALALPAIVVTQTVGRFAGDGLIERLGAATSGRLVAVALLAGLIVIVMAPVTGMVLAGFALIGVGVSTVLPQAFSAAARWGDRPAAESMAAFATLSTVMGFLGPPVFGALAEWVRTARRFRAVHTAAADLDRIRRLSGTKGGSRGRGTARCLTRANALPCCSAQRDLSPVWERHERSCP